MENSLKHIVRALVENVASAHGQRRQGKARRHASPAAVVLLLTMVGGCTGEHAASPTEPGFDFASEAAAAASADDRRGAGGGGGKSTPMLTLKDAITTDSTQAVKIHKDTKRELTVGGDIVATINFSLTHAAFGAAEQILATCNVVPATTPVEHQLELLAMLVDPAARGWGLWMSVDRTRLGAPADHGIMLHADEGVNIGIGQQSLLPEAGGVTVIEGGDGSYSYSGGALQIQDVRGQELEHVSLACPNLDIVVAVVSR